MYYVLCRVVWFKCGLLYEKNIRNTLLCTSLSKWAELSTRPLWQDQDQDQDRMGKTETKTLTCWSSKTKTKKWEWLPLVHVLFYTLMIHGPQSWLIDWVIGWLVFYGTTTHDRFVRRTALTTYVAVLVQLVNGPYWCKIGVVGFARSMLTMQCCFEQGCQRCITALRRLQITMSILYNTNLNNSI